MELNTRFFIQEKKILLVKLTRTYSSYLNSNLDILGEQGQKT